MRTKNIVALSVAAAVCGLVLAIGLVVQIGELMLSPAAWNQELAIMDVPEVPRVPETKVSRDELPAMRGPVASAKDYRLSGPHTHANLAVYLIHGPDKARSQAFMTLQEALDQNKAMVHDTGIALAVDNYAKTPLFIQAGDIVKGGNQDRVAPYDLIVPPETNRTPLHAYCVEQGRSGPRGEEISASFQSSTELLPGRRLKLAALHHRSQNEIWEVVRRTQLSLSQNVGAPVQAALSQTSLQLTLENGLVRQAIDGYLQDLSALPGGKDNVIGFAVAINGQIHGADVYASAGLFKTLWPKLLRASAVEALTEKQGQAETAAPAVEAVTAFLAQAEAGTSFRQHLGGRVHVIRHETEHNLLFDTCDQGQQNLVLHRSYLAK